MSSSYFGQTSYLTTRYGNGYSPVKTSRYSTGWIRSNRDTGFYRPPASVARKYKGSTYEELKAECMESNTLFEDPDFLPVDTNIFFSKAPPQPFEWLRPAEIAAKHGAEPQFILDGASRFDIKQGELGDCWLLAALASLSIYPELMDHVVPPDQSFSSDYAGIFRFRFWTFGRWVEVVVDDRLPTYKGRLVFLQSVAKNEFWSCLLEKAYAKMCGSYEALKGGSTGEAFIDFTGGICEVIELGEKTPNDLLQVMIQAHDRQSLMGCSIEASPGQFEARLPNGLVMGHAYSITSIVMADIKTINKEGKIPLVRMRNPWGNEVEWRGRFSDGSPEWQLIPAEVKEDVGLVFEKDGEFWMSFDDFKKNFKKLELCYLSADTLEGAGSKKKWEMTTSEGSWKKFVSAGGCRNYIDTFWTNPQFKFEVTDPDDTDDEDMGTVIISLTQKGMRKRKKEGIDLFTIGYVVYALKDPNVNLLDKAFFKRNATVAKSRFINTRDVCERHKLKVGHYVVIPSTFEPGEECDFLLRMYGEKAISSKELDEKTAIKKDDDADKAPLPKDEVEEQTEKKLKEAFKTIAGEDMEIDAYELQDILNSIFKSEFTFDGFSSDTSRSLVATRDTDASGKLGYEEFKKLWNEMRKWKLAFKNQDIDGNGTFSSFELRRALKDIGYTVSNQTLNSLVRRYSSKDGKIYFDDFIHMVARLTTMFEIYKEMSEDAEGSMAKFTMDSFIQTVMYT